MRIFLHLLLIFYHFLLVNIPCCSQSDSDFTDVWLFGGVSYQYSSSVRLEAQAIYLNRQQEFAGYWQAFINTGKFLTVNPAYLFLPKAITGNTEHTFHTGFIFTRTVNNFVVDNRLLVWNRFRTEAEDLHFVRNRLRAIFPFVMNRSQARVYLFDEAFYSFSDTRWERNRIGCGLGYMTMSWLDLDAAFVYQRNLQASSAYLFFLSANLQLVRKLPSNK